MPAGVLRRCSICKRFHAAYQVEEGGQKWLLCKRCWDARFSPRGAIKPANINETPKKYQVNSVCHVQG